MFNPSSPIPGDKLFNGHIMMQDEYKIPQFKQNWNNNQTFPHGRDSCKEMGEPHSIGLNIDQNKIINSQFGSKLGNFQTYTEPRWGYQENNMGDVVNNNINMIQQGIVREKSFDDSSNQPSSNKTPKEIILGPPRLSPVQTNIAQTTCSPSKKYRLGKKRREALIREEVSLLKQENDILEQELNKVKGRYEACLLAIESLNSSYIWATRNLRILKPLQSISSLGRNLAGKINDYNNNNNNNNENGEISKKKNNSEDNTSCENDSLISNKKINTEQHNRTPTSYGFIFFLILLIPFLIATAGSIQISRLPLFSKESSNQILGRKGEGWSFRIMRNTFDVKSKDEGNGGFLLHNHLEHQKPCLDIKSQDFIYFARFRDSFLETLDLQEEEE